MKKKKKKHTPTWRSNTVCLRIFTQRIGRLRPCWWTGRGKQVGGRVGEGCETQTNDNDLLRTERGDTPHSAPLRSITFFLSFKIFNENSSTPRPAWGSSRRLWLTLPAAPVPHPPRPLLQLSGSAGRPGSRRRCGTRGWRGVCGGAPRLAALSRRTDRRRGA